MEIVSSSSFNKPNIFICANRFDYEMKSSFLLYQNTSCLIYDYKINILTIISNHQECLNIKTAYYEEIGIFSLICYEDKNVYKMINYQYNIEIYKLNNDFSLYSNNSQELQ